MSNRAGFTLIEILVVVLIISITTSLIVLNLNTNRASPRVIEDAARQLKLVIDVAQEQAVLQPAELGIRFELDHYRVVRLFVGEGNEAKWSDVQNDKLLREHNIPENVNVTVEIENEDKVLLSPQLQFYSSGDMTPFTIEIGDFDHPAQFTLEGKANGEVQLKRVE